ncbi:MAG: isochorismatase family cysteine hydrolase [Coriobacteriales bacterium]|nr:cysteine hydrolase [Coriobacteriaceae bacterium]MDY2722635.1 isochorismatase family cysteine hydrolase [Coriobacteriales bacterium]MDY5662291.1 isochorismatase family cysteine hydrolase [Coriobacteriales bacterium]
MAYTPVAQQTAWQTSNDIDLSSTAILVIDVLGGTDPIPEAFVEPIGACVSIVKAARAKGVPVIFSDDNHIPAYDREIELWGEHGIRGTQGGEPVAAFDLQPGDIVIPKRRYDGFFQTDLDLTLRELGVDTLIAVGADANICVLQTLAGAYFRGYKTIVPADAVWTFLVGTYEGALEYYTRCYDTRVVESKTILEDYLA